MGIHLKVLVESYPMNTNMTGFRWFSKLFTFFLQWTKVASAGKGLRASALECTDQIIFK